MKARRIILPVAIVLVGVAVAAGLGLFAPEAERNQPPPQEPTVEVLRLEAQSAVARVHATGVVEPSRQVAVTPQVSGKVVEQSAALIPGGRFREGELLLRIEPRDYQLAIQEAQSQVKQAEVNLQLEQGRKTIAEREWELLGIGGAGEDPEASALALREPQLAAARVALKAARSTLERARLNLSRTELRAPFNALVLSEQVEVGQLVGPSAPVATLVGSDRFWVQVSVPVDQLSVLRFPAPDAPTGSPAIIRQTPAQPDAPERRGHVLKLLGQLDEETRTAQVLVAVDQPLDDEPPLLPGAFTRVEILGRPLEEVFVLPRVAVNDGSTVWVVGDGNRLERRTVRIRWRQREELFVQGDLESGERVMLTPLSLPVEGMAVQVQPPGAR